MRKIVLYLQFMSDVNEEIIDDPASNQTEICETQYDNPSALSSGINTEDESSNNYVIQVRKHNIFMY